MLASDGVNIEFQLTFIFLGSTYIC